MRFLFVIAMLFILTACSELRIIGGAAVREFKAEGISTERVAYNVSKN
jgi:hypothetical protein